MLIKSPARAEGHALVCLAVGIRCADHADRLNRRQRLSNEQNVFRRSGVPRVDRCVRRSKKVREIDTRRNVDFDYDVAEKAEFLRDYQALESLKQEHLKNDDETMKKWIELI
jgi:hypothetical protein